MLEQSHGFLEYIGMILVEERNSLNNQFIFDFIQTFFPKVKYFIYLFIEDLSDVFTSIQVIGHAVAERIHAAITRVANNIKETIPPSFLFTQPIALRVLNGDLRALQIVSETAPTHLTRELLNALLAIKGRLDIAFAGIRGKNKIFEEN